jgi:hypothetical protein
LTFNFSKRLREFFALTIERRKYEDRFAAGEGSTVPKPFLFAQTSERAAVRAAKDAERGASLHPSAHHSVTLEEQRQYEARLRRANHEELTRARREYDARERDSDGFVKPTTATSFHFHTAERQRLHEEAHAEKLVAVHPRFSISQRDVEAYNSSLREVDHAELARQGRVYNQR